MKRTYTLLFLFAGAVLSSGLIIGCLPQEKKVHPQPANKPPKAAAQKPQLPPPDAPPSRISLDFDQAPLADVAQFVTQQTGSGFTLNGTGNTPISWIEYNIPRETLLDAFRRTLIASNLTLFPAQDQRSTFAIQQIEEPPVALQLNYATSQRGTWFALGSTVYPRSSFPFPVKYQNGHWFAMVPKSTAEQFTNQEGPAKTGDQEPGRDAAAGMPR